MAESTLALVEWSQAGELIRGVLHTPASPSGDALVLTHGAGGDCESPLLRALAGALAAAGVGVLRCNLRFRQLRPKGPPGRGDAGRDRAGLAAAVAAMRQRFLGRVLLGGHSYGGRQASMLAADEPTLLDGLLLLSYPLHPPGKPDQLRTAHFPRLRTRTLFVSGAADPFATAEELELARGLIPAATAMLRRDGAGHELLRRRNDPAVAAEVAAAIAESVLSFFFDAPSPGGRAR